MKTPFASIARRPPERRTGRSVPRAPAGCSLPRSEAKGSRRRAGLGRALDAGRTPRAPISSTSRARRASSACSCLISRRLLRISPARRSTPPPLAPLPHQRSRSARLRLLDRRAARARRASASRAEARGLGDAGAVLAISAARGARDVADSTGGARAPPGPRRKARRAGGRARPPPGARPACGRAPPALAGRRARAPCARSAMLGALGAQPPALGLERDERAVRLARWRARTRAARRAPRAGCLPCARGPPAASRCARAARRAPSCRDGCACGAERRAARARASRSAGSGLGLPLRGDRRDAPRDLVGVAEVVAR